MTENSVEFDGEVFEEPLSFGEMKNKEKLVRRVRTLDLTRRTLKSYPLNQSRLCQ